MKHANYDLGQGTQCFEIPIDRRDVGRLIILESSVITGMFAGVLSEDAIRESIEVCLKSVLERDGKKLRVFTNGSLAGPTISTMVQFVD